MLHSESMNRQQLCALLLLSLLALAGCGGPLSKYDRDRASESSWVIHKKSLVIGGVRTYHIDLRTDGPRFDAKIKTEVYDLETERKKKIVWHTLCDGEYVYVTRPQSVAKAKEGMSKSATRWKIESEFLRPQQFWKSNYLAGAPEDKGTKEIDGKSYKYLVSTMGNAMGGTTKYGYAVDEEKGYYRELTREFVGDSHTDVYSCTSYKSSTTATIADFTFQGETKDVMKFDIFNEDF